MKTGVIICGYAQSVHNLGVLAGGLRAAGLYTVIGYDAETIMPDADTVNSCDMFFSGGGHAGRRDGELRSLKAGVRIVDDHYCEYTLKLTGDVTISAPGKIVELVEVLGKDDLITSQWNGINGTMVFFGKTRKIKAVINDITEGFPQLEKKFADALVRNNLKTTIYPCLEDDRGVWGSIGYERGNGNYPPITEILDGNDV